MIDTLFGMILENCQDLIDTIQNIQDEFRNTTTIENTNYAKGSSNHLPSDIFLFKRLVNANTTRKIFEDEDPNPFQEKILLDQLSYQSILDLTTNS